MRKAMLLAIAIYLTLALSGIAAQSSVGRWQLDVSQSDFGSDSSPAEMSLTVLEDRPRILEGLWLPVVRKES